MKDKIRVWMADFESEHGRDPVIEEYPFFDQYTNMKIIYEMITLRTEEAEDVVCNDLATLQAASLTLSQVNERLSLLGIDTID